MHTPTNNVAKQVRSVVIKDIYDAARQYGGHTSGPAGGELYYALLSHMDDVPATMGLYNIRDQISNFIESQFNDR